MKRYFYLSLGTVVLSCIGIIYAWSILASPIANDFPSWSSVQLSLTFTICLFSFCIGGFLRGISAEKMSIRLVLWFAAVLYGAGLIISTQVQDSILLLYFGFGAMGGLATGFTYNAIMSAITPWFQEKSGLISGILLMGFGFGGFLTGKLYQILITILHLQWREIFVVFAIAVAVLLFLAGLFIHPPHEQIESGKDIKENTIDKSGSEMIKARAFQFYFIWVVLLASSGYMVMGHGKGILLEANPLVSDSSAATIVGLISIFNGCGRIIFGVLYDKLSYKKTMLIVGGVFACAVTFISTGLHAGYSGLISAGFICTGMFFAGVASMNSTFVIDFFGTKYYATNFAIVNLNVLISSFGSTVAGFIYDAKGSYVFVLGLMGIIWVASLGCAFMIKRQG